MTERKHEINELVHGNEVEPGYLCDESEYEHGVVGVADVEQRYQHHQLQRVYRPPQHLQGGRQENVKS